MAKSTSFAEKVAKSAEDHTRHCSVCDQSITTVKLVTSEYSPETGAWRFRQKFVGICKCNEKEYTG
jgi:hypothetical protein